MNAVINFGLLDYLAHFVAIAIMGLVLALMKDFRRIPSKDRDEND